MHNIIIIDNDNNVDVSYFGNYYRKSFGDAMLFSGDVTRPTGTEYYDLKLDELRAKGVRYIIQTFHGFCSRLDRGEIYCGYQDKTNLNTQAWDPKNIELKIHVHGDTRAFMSFGIDLQTKEVIMFNMLLEDENRVVSGELKDTVMKYLSPSFLALNVYDVAVNRATEVVATPEEADVVFDDTYQPAPVEPNAEVKPVKVIRSYDVETLAGLATGAELK